MSMNDIPNGENRVLQIIIEENSKEKRALKHFCLSWEDV